MPHDLFKHRAVIQDGAYPMLNPSHHKRLGIAYRGIEYSSSKQAPVCVYYATTIYGTYPVQKLIKVAGACRPARRVVSRLEVRK